MKFLSEFRDPVLAKQLAAKLQKLAVRPITIMEICGTHTMAIARGAIRDVLPKELKLVSGPGCPVCVTPQGYVDEAIKLSRQKDVIIATFGDMLRVPGSLGSLLNEKNQGNDIRIVYSPLDATKIALDNPNKQVVFLGIGFETTAPIVGLAILQAAQQGINNYSVFSAHKVVPPAMQALVADAELNIQGFLCPGHVSCVIGIEPYRFLAEQYRTPAVIAGFEPIDILQGLLKLTELIMEKSPQVVNNYSRVVQQDGNPNALAVMEQVFIKSHSAWRGIGVITESGLAIRPQYAKYDARFVFSLPHVDREMPSACNCGDILQGKKTPPDCPLFRKLCTPENPIGACMVSGEGTCAAYYKYDLE
ncbi:hydrogenase formation protein HypD [Dendrosporobacter sp. 1207_IL3150]|uniref:hydrogenase formation protein HypD n=1 Tax=Dendrosporobacter sp. 1207_IL3150 TaxID=3084054 RepID=UPI002FDB66CB